ncbi:MAG: glycosyltransferase [Bacteroidales bacterium]|jgi:glycosyltransferase involved in cell wall biosynthesis|nr:glycosyltransferase [Bacteroidales bacterium]
MIAKTIYIAIPAMNEKEYLPFTLHSIAQQQCRATIKIYICINQPESWWENPDKRSICENNRQTGELLKKYSNLDITLIDKSSKGMGWDNKKQGVGCARKLLVDNILSVASDADVLINMDADTIFESNYCQSILDNLESHTKAIAIAVPYYHPLTGSETENRAMLRYEIYTRNYNLNLLRINSPYAYTALGSAIVCNIKSCRAVGGFDTQASGEDFYFLQKLSKYGKILRYNTSKTYPATRYSFRVPFGTGPAIYKGSLGDWSSYPVFHHSGFDIIKNTYEQINTLFRQNIDNSFIDFLKTAFGADDLWSPLRKNYKSLPAFTRAFHNKIDGLRIFQFLRHYQYNTVKNTDEICLSDFFKQYYPHKCSYFFREKETFSFMKIPLDKLNELRDFLMEEETIYQQIHDKNLN